MILGTVSKKTHVCDLFLFIRGVVSQFKGKTAAKFIVLY